MKYAVEYFITKHFTCSRQSSEPEYIAGAAAPPTATAFNFLWFINRV